MSPRLGSPHHQPSKETGMSTRERTAIDISPPATSRPTLALVLALLAVPGSTLAWDLPLGGLWVGLPLALAAIVLGLRARREATGAGRATAAIIVAGLCILQMAVWSAVSVANGSADRAAPATTLVFKELDKGAKLTHIRNTDGPRRANLQGDVISSVSPLTDEAGARVGKSHLACITTKGARNFLDSQMTCTAIAELHGGTLIAQFVDGIDETVTGAITGGTGAYAGATGVFVAEPTDYGSLNTVSLGADGR
jgi:hypothetical protein